MSFNDKWEKENMVYECNESIIQLKNEWQY